LLVGVGLAFELPIILTGLSAVGIVSSKWLASKRKIWFVLAFIIAAFITPTFDPMNQAIIAGPLIVLYELSIWLTKIIKKRKPSTGVVTT
jgi:sec-independent protein translocase protein TatC